MTTNIMFLALKFLPLFSCLDVYSHVMPHKNSESGLLNLFYGPFIKSKMRIIIIKVNVLVFLRKWMYSNINETKNVSGLMIGLLDSCLINPSMPWASSVYIFSPSKVKIYFVFIHSLINPKFHVFNAASFKGAKFFNRKKQFLLHGCFIFPFIYFPWCLREAMDIHLQKLQIFFSIFGIWFWRMFFHC